MNNLNLKVSRKIVYARSSKFRSSTCKAREKMAMFAPRSAAWRCLSTSRHVPAKVRIQRQHVSRTRPGGAVLASSDKCQAKCSPLLNLISMAGHGRLPLFSKLFSKEFGKFGKFGKRFGKTFPKFCPSELLF